jgi:hypothetical protein
MASLLELALSCKKIFPDSFTDMIIHVSSN